MDEVKGVILCGGEGTRLRPLTYYIQKTMIPIGVKQKPLLEYVVQLLKFHGIKKLVLLVDYKAGQIINYFARGSRFGVEISYVHDDPSLKGTAGSVINAYKKGAIDKKDKVLVYYGDILTNINIKGLLRVHEEKNASATVVLAAGFTVRVGVADLDKQNRIQGFVEKPTLEKPVSIGILVLEGKTFEQIERLKRGKARLDLMGDVIPHLIKTGEPVFGYLSDAFWYDVVSMEAYEKLKPKAVEEALSFLF
ncbi:MAG: nucleotidyltransferase family protein [Thermoproteota archaeon]|nr:nucleotidyltransferase family protein [Thermoproteota archaeon]